MTAQGWDPRGLVLDYSDPAGEARACRTDCALFDFSFVARARVEGPAALACVGVLTHRPLHDLEIGKIGYALREDARGHLVSDLTVWKHDETHYEVMSGRREDITALAAVSGRAAEVADLSAETAILALQGPNALGALQDIANTQRLARLGYFCHCRAEIAGIPCQVGRLGFSGEAGFEIVLPRPERQRLWDLLGRRARPAGFAAADILRIEAGFVLFANEFRVPVSAREAGLAKFTANRGAGPEPLTVLICFQAVAEESPLLWQPAKCPAWPPAAGSIVVTSACHSVVAGTILGLGYALRSDVAAGRNLADPTATFRDIERVSLPFYDPQKRRPRADWYSP